MATETLAVDGVGVNDGFTLILGASKVAAVARPDDANTTYIEGTLAQLQDFTFGNSSIAASDLITNVRLSVRNRGVIVGSPAFATITAGSTSSNQPLSNGVGYITDNFDFPTAPSGALWTVSLLNSMYTTINANGSTVDVTTVDATVTYIVGGLVSSRLAVLGVG